MAMGHWPMFENEDQRLAVVGTLIVLPAVWSLPLVFSYWLAQRQGRYLLYVSFPLAWVCLEVVQYYWAFPIPWLHLGIGLANTPYLLKLYPIVGQEGATLLIVSCNTAIVYLLDSCKNHQFKPIQVVPLVVVVVVVAVVPALLPALSKKEKEIKLVVFQPDALERDKVANNLPGQINMLRQALQSVKLEKADLLVCPESFFGDMYTFPLMVNNLEEHPGIKELMEISARHHVPILSGAVLVETFESKDPPTYSAKMKEPGVYFDIYNGSVFITPDGRVEWQTKRKLVPFAEEVPFYRIFNFLEEKGLWPARYEHTYAYSDKIGYYEYDGLKIASGICFESYFPSVISEYIDRSADLLVIHSSDWIDSDYLIRQHQDNMMINASAFSLPVVYATLDRKSLVALPDQGKVLLQDRLDVQKMKLIKGEVTYRVVSKYLWSWLLVAFLIIFVMRVHIKITR